MVGGDLFSRGPMLIADNSHFLTSEDITQDAWCCMGAVNDGPTACTCWEPVFDLEQQPLQPGIPTARRQRCHDCAFRPDSPERARGEDPEDLPTFACHQGMRRAVAYRHPDGRERPTRGHDDYQPPIGPGGRPYRADGTPADVCAGWMQHDRRMKA